MSDTTEQTNLDAPPPISAEQRAKILSDPNVTKMAAELEMTLDEFVNTVGYYLNNPGVEPAFLVVSDDNLKKMGVHAPTNAELEASVKASVEAIKAGQGPSGFDKTKKNAVELSNAGGKALSAASNPDLEAVVKKSRPRGKT